MNLKISHLLLLVLLPFVVNAQQSDSLLKSATIEVIQSYKPEVKRSPKPKFKVELPPRDTSRPDLNYDVPQQTLLYNYSSLPLRPLSLGKDSTKLPFSSYLKLGGGNQSTIYFDAGTDLLKGKNYYTNFHVHHLSQNGNIKNQKVSLSGIEAEGTLNTNKEILHLSLDGSLNQYHFYGYDHDIYSYSSSATLQSFTGVSAIFDIKNKEGNSVGINYHPSVGASFYNDNYHTEESSISFDLPASKKINNYFNVGLGINGVITHLTDSIKNLNNDILQITPNLNYTRGNISVKLGLYPSFGINSSSYLLPDVLIKFQIPKSQLTISGGWESQLKQNTFKQLTSINPYMFDIYQTRQSRIDAIFIKAQNSFGNHVIGSLKVSWLQHSNMPLFLNDSGDRKRFYILYDGKVSTLSFEGALRYQVANNLSIGGTLTYNDFIEKSYEKVWHEPGFTFKADLLWHPTSSFSFSAYTNLLEQIFALDRYHQTIKLDGVFDLGIGAEYLIIPRLSAFININNILNDRYQRWYGYESYGINLYGGIRFKF